ncbi:hypothetical protein Tco_0289573 [Tanacetum coccineum]
MSPSLILHPTWLLPCWQSPISPLANVRDKEMKGQDKRTWATLKIKGQDDFCFLLTHLVQPSFLSAKKNKGKKTKIEEVKVT